MRKTVSVAQATAQEAVLPARVQEALGELVGVAREGLLALLERMLAGVSTRRYRRTQEPIGSDVERAAERAFGRWKLVEDQPGNARKR